MKRNKVSEKGMGKKMLREQERIVKVQEEDTIERKKK